MKDIINLFCAAEVFARIKKLMGILVYRSDVVATQLETFDSKLKNENP
jgi:hypothetical protein